MEKLSFELWIFTTKQLGQTFDSAMEVFNRLSEEEQKKIIEEYNQYKNS